MKRTAVLCLVLTLSLLVPSLILTQTPTAKASVFSVKFEAKGQADREWFEKNVEAVYAPCSIWNGRFGSGTPETMLKERGGIAGMKPGEVLQLYIRQKTGTAKDSSGLSGSVKTIGDGLFSWTWVRGHETGTSDNSGAASNNPASGPASVSLAEIRRTEDGAEVWISEPSAEIEGEGEFFGLFDGNNVVEGLTEAMTFTFTNAELKNWASLQRVNDRTLAGSEGGTLKIKVSFQGGTLTGSAAGK
jgi:hypothetical protein